MNVSWCNSWSLEFLNGPKYNYWHETNQSVLSVSIHINAILQTTKVRLCLFVCRILDPALNELLLSGG